MSYELIIINIFGILIEACLISYIFRIIAEKKVPIYLSIVFYSIFIILQSIIVIFLHLPYVNQLVIFILIFLLSFMYRLSWFKRILASVILTLAFILSEMLMGLIVSSLSGSTVEEHQTNLFFYIQCVIGSKILVLILAQCYKIFATKNTARLSKGMYASMILLPLASCFIVFATTKLMFSSNDSQLAILMAIGIICIIIANFIIVYFVERNIKQINEEANNRLVYQVTKQEVKYYEEMITKYKISNKRIHDIDKQLLIIKNMVNNNNIVSNEIEKVESIISTVKNIAYTGNASLDAIINDAENKIKNTGINFNKNFFMLQIQDTIIMDVCLLLGNLLDNSIEECLRLNEVDRQNASIKLEVKQVNYYLHIMMENTKRINVNIMQSSKKDVYKHGYGLEIIKELVEKYNGNLTIESANNAFTVMILLNVFEGTKTT